MKILVPKGVAHRMCKERIAVGVSFRESLDGESTVNSQSMKNAMQAKENTQFEQHKIEKLPNQVPTDTTNDPELCIGCKRCKHCSKTMSGNVQRYWSFTLNFSFENI